MTNTDRDLVLMAAAETVGRTHTFKPYRQCTAMRVEANGNLILFPPRFSKAASKNYSQAILAGREVQP